MPGITEFLKWGRKTITGAYYASWVKVGTSSASTAGRVMWVYPVPEPHARYWWVHPVRALQAQSFWALGGSTVHLQEALAAHWKVAFLCIVHFTGDLKTTQVGYNYIEDESCTHAFHIRQVFWNSWVFFLLHSYAIYRLSLEAHDFMLWTPSNVCIYFSNINLNVSTQKQIMGKNK